MSTECPLNVTAYRRQRRPAMVRAVLESIAAGLVDHYRIDGVRMEMPRILVSGLIRDGLVVRASKRPLRYELTERGRKEIGR